MRKILCIFFCSLILCGCSFTSLAVGEKITFDNHASIIDIASKISPAVVGIGGVKKSSESVGCFQTALVRDQWAGVRRVQTE